MSRPRSTSRPKPPRMRSAAASGLQRPRGIDTQPGDCRRARLGQVAADPAGELAVCVEEPDRLDRALPAGPRKAPAGGG